MFNVWTDSHHWKSCFLQLRTLLLQWSSKQLCLAFPLTWRLSVASQLRISLFHHNGIKISETAICSSLLLTDLQLSSRKLAIWLPGSLTTDHRRYKTIYVICLSGFIRKWDDKFYIAVLKQLGMLNKQFGHPRLYLNENRLADCCVLQTTSGCLRRSRFTDNTSLWSSIIQSRCSVPFYLKFWLQVDTPF